MSSSMVSTTGLPSGAALATAKKAAAAKAAAAAKKPRAKPNHPRTSDMVDAAIAALKERGGSSLQAIKKYIAGTYTVDAEKLSPFIKKYLKSGVVAKKLVQTKGKGASGSFKLSLGDGSAGVNSPRRAAVAKRRTVAKKAVVTAAAKVKKSPAKAKKSSPKKKVLKTLAAKPPKPKAAKKPAAKKSVVARKSVVAKKTRKAPAKK